MMFLGWRLYPRGGKLLMIILIRTANICWTLTKFQALCSGQKIDFPFYAMNPCPWELTIQEKQSVFQNSLHINRITRVKYRSFLLFQPVYWLSHDSHPFLGYSNTIQAPRPWHWTQSYDLVTKKYMELVGQDYISEHENPNEMRIRGRWDSSQVCSLKGDCDPCGVRSMPPAPRVAPFPSSHILYLSWSQSYVSLHWSLIGRVPQPQPLSFTPAPPKFFSRHFHIPHSFSVLQPQ